VGGERIVSEGATTAVLLLGLGVIAVRRRSVAIGLVAGQALVLGVAALALAADRSSELLVAGAVLLTKAAVLPALLLLLLRRTREPRRVVPAAGPLARLAAGGAIVLAGSVLVPPLGLGDAHVERSAVALVLLGIAIVVARRPALFQLLGLMVAENGLSLLAVAVPGGLPYVVELGALMDLALVVTVAAALTWRIHGELGTGDTELLRGLRD
jgi:hydrogenase-4 component E